MVSFGKTIYKLEQQDKETCNILICKSGWWACHNCRNYSSLIEGVSVYLHFPLRLPKLCLSAHQLPLDFCGHRAGGSHPNRKGEVGDPRKAKQRLQGKRRWTNTRLHHARAIYMLFRQLLQTHRRDLQIDILEDFFSCFPSISCCLVKLTMELHQHTNVFPLHWQNVCYKFVCDDSVGGLFA